MSGKIGFGAGQKDRGSSDELDTSPDSRKVPPAVLVAGGNQDHRLSRP